MPTELLSLATTAAVQWKEKSLSMAAMRRNSEGKPVGGAPRG